MTLVTTVGVLLAAGAGRRMGRPKALVGDWLERAVGSLAPCDRVVVVLGAEAERARARVPDGPGGPQVVVARDWAEGMAASLRAGLAVLAPGEHALVTLVDLPDVGVEVVGRLLDKGVDGATLRRAAYDGVPGHPVLLGADHASVVATTATGDRGARDHLRDHDVELVECGDLASGVDVDTPEGPAGRLSGPDGS